jgi:hypothetical protein
MNSIGQIGNISCSYTSHAIEGNISNLGRSHSEVAEKHVKKSESETRVSNVSLPYPPIVSHVDMEFTCQSINLFRCHTTVAEHSNLPVNRKKATFFIFYIMRDKNIQQS